MASAIERASPASASDFALTPTSVARHGRRTPSAATRSRSHALQKVSLVPVMKPTRSRRSCAGMHVFRGPAVGVDPRFFRLDEGSQSLAHRRRRDEVRADDARPFGDGHQLDETRRDAAIPRIARERDELIVIFAAKHDAVDLDLAKAGAARGVDAGEHAFEIAAAGDAPKARRIERIERHRESLEPRSGKRPSPAW